MPVKVKNITVEIDGKNLVLKLETFSALRNELREALLSLAPLFAETPFFMSEEFSLVDCYLAPLLWRLPALKIELSGTGSKDVRGYMNRIFDRSSFKASLTDQEREIHNPL